MNGYRLFELFAFSGAGFIFGRDGNLPFAILLLIPAALFAYLDFRRNDVSAV